MEDRTARFRIGQLAARTGVGPERLRKWESRYGLLEPQRSGGGFRVYSLEDERRVRLMERHLARGYAAAEAAELARQGIVAPSPARLGSRIPRRALDRSRALMQHAIENYDEGAAQRALDDLFNAFTIEAVIRDALMPFLREIGERWARGETTPGQEHFASTIIEARLMSMTRGWGSGAGPTALLACPSGERHTLGLVALGIALSRQGWRITYLGADTPCASIATAAARIRPALIALAAAQSRWYANCADALRGITTSHRLTLAGAGASAALAGSAGAEHVTSDPVTAAASVAAAKQDRPA